ncbi:hypothetical protein L210DRAFT_3105979 [Boletus edulis BED1]|uniref:Uncharacterized protein n=1 Tax=Boletus edulis BED1 TaxID=1328754 RepID=A0AAD4GIA9_BOLED|nr:hypothetical protein L210DRAFT_3105979 [Boletus edulis BED1]
MAWSTIFEYKTRLGVRSDDTHITSVKLPDNGMPSSPVPFITLSGLVTLQHDLKACIHSSPLVKVPLTMRPLVKKRTSIPFSLTFTLKRRSTIFSRSSSPCSTASASPSCTPASEMADPLSIAVVAIELPSEVSLHNTPSIGTKILDRFWPEDEESYSEESCRVSVASRYPTALAPPPHHRRTPCSLGSIRDVPFIDQLPPRTSSDNTSPLQFPF